MIQQNVFKSSDRIFNTLRNKNSLLMPYIYNPGYTEPSGDSILWQYMGLAKFSSIILLGKLFFASINELRRVDPYEGIFIDEDLRLFLTNESLKKFDDDIYGRLKGTIINLSSYIEKISRDVFANCWHMGKHESPAMWKLYSLQEQGIVIKTTYENLKKQ